VAAHLCRRRPHHVPCRRHAPSRVSILAWRAVSSLLAEMKHPTVCPPASCTRFRMLNTVQGGRKRRGVIAPTARRVSCRIIAGLSGFDPVPKPQAHVVVVPCGQFVAISVANGDFIHRHVDVGLKPKTRRSVRMKLVHIELCASASACSGVLSTPA
jgi:hypothetical protein